MRRPSKIDYILVSKRSASAVQAFGIAAPDDLMVDYGHSVLFCHMDVVQLLELGERKTAALLPQRRSCWQPLPAPRCRQHAPVGQLNVGLAAQQYQPVAPDPYRCGLDAGHCEHGRDTRRPARPM